MPTPTSIDIVLASASPRRKDLLQRAGVGFEIVPADVPELERPGESPSEMVARLASEKALTVAQRLGPTPVRWVLGADTIVVLDDRVLGKPDDPEHAVALLASLVGRRHRVITGYCWVETAALRPNAGFETSEVEMRDADEVEIRDYVATGEPLDKAGAYALQGQGGTFVSAVAGSRENVIGLPVTQVLAALERCLAERGGEAAGAAGS